MVIGKPCSPSCERNRDPILDVLRIHFAEARSVLEIGSGTGQHAVHFAAAMPWLQWQCSDREEYLPGIREWLDEAALLNTPTPVELDVASEPWLLPPLPFTGEGWGEGVPHAISQDQECPHPAFGHPQPLDAASIPQAGEGRGQVKGGSLGFDAVFTANTLHIMGWDEVEAFFAGLDKVLAYDATVVAYGPFNYGGEFTSDSNRQFDASLRARDPRMGLRDFEAVEALARAMGLRLVEDVAMPANNRTLVWRRSEALVNAR